ncbi:DTW domain-containing protein [Shewanella sp. SR44-3]|uniref:tRNA-uridine aminocarboxypropyltransferase n=1 Tax=unclassified Shewanella TaxID=196818 RepID=UPI0028736390|nr:DTW domain-containing protein [Shewanella sp. SR44-3]
MSDESFSHEDIFLADTHQPLGPHAVHKLYLQRKALSTKPFGARGKKLVRCNACLLGQQFCTCEFRRQLKTNVSFLLIMYDDEVLKPTNSGRLIADLVPETHAYIWSRTQTDAAMLALLNNPEYQAYLVFPGQYAHTGQEILSSINNTGIRLSMKAPVKRPLLIMLDGSWREAIKMFRKSPYLHHLPLLSFDPKVLATYALRKGSHDFQLGTAEVAALAIEAAGEPHNGLVLSAWFDLFVESSLLGRNRRCKEDILPIKNYQDKFTRALALSYQASSLKNE